MKKILFFLLLITAISYGQTGTFKTGKIQLNTPERTIDTLTQVVVRDSITGITKIMSRKDFLKGISGSASTTNNLDQVLTAGNTTTKDIVVGSVKVSQNSSIYPVKNMGMYPPYGFYLDGDTGSAYYQLGKIQWLTSDYKSAEIYPPTNQTADVAYFKLPDMQDNFNYQKYTLPISVNGFLADDNGNITIDTSASVPTLQQVVNAGSALNSTSEIYYTYPNSDYKAYYSSYGSGVLSETGKGVEISPTKIEIVNDVNQKVQILPFGIVTATSSGTALQSATLLTGSRNFEYPDTSGTLVVDSDLALKQDVLGFTPYNASNPAGYISSVPAQSFSSLIGKPTTLGGFGITDAYPLSGNPSGFITNSSLSSYLTSATASNTYQPIGSYLTSYTETDPAVKAINGLVKSNGTTISTAVAGTDYLAPNGSAGALTSFPTLNQNTTGTASTITGTITESQVANLVSDLAAKQGIISLTTTGTSGASTLIGNTLNIPNYAGATSQWTTSVNDIQNNNTGNVGIGTAPRTKLEVGGDGAILATGTLSSGWTEPSIGAGVRMLFYPRKAAFRAGSVSGTQWNDANIGYYSFAGGVNNTSSNNGSTTFGSTNVTSGQNAFTTGTSSSVSGYSAFGAGLGIASQSCYSAVFGYYNIGGGNSLSIIPTDPIFEIGNGTNTVRANAFTVLKNGNATFSNNLTALSFIKTGGLATEFLMADGSVSTAGGGSDATKLAILNNLSDLNNTTTARTNLGLGTLATQSGTFSGTSSGVNTGDQTDITGTAGTITGSITESQVTNLVSDLALKESASNKSDSYTVSSSTTYASTKALVDGLANYQPNETVVNYQSDFFNNSTLGNTPFVGSAVSSGTTALSVVNLTGNHEGVIRISSSTTTNSGYRWQTDVTNQMFKGGEKFTAIINPQTLALTTTRVGFHDATTVTDAVDGAYFEMSNTGAIVLKTSNNSVRTTSSVIATLVTNNWYKLKITVNSNATSILGEVFDTSGNFIASQTITTNIPTTAARSFSSGLVSTNSGTVVAALMDIDYMAMSFSMTR